jgi:hypothetical protein
MPALQSLSSSGAELSCPPKKSLKMRAVIEKKIIIPNTIMSIAATTDAGGFELFIQGIYAPGVVAVSYNDLSSPLSLSIQDLELIRILINYCMQVADKSPVAIMP